MKKSKRFLFMLPSAMLAVVLYITFHELGHLIVMLSAGETIVDFSIITAHVSGTGGNYTDLSALWLYANGALLPIFVSYIYMLFYKSNNEKPFYRFFSYMVALIPIASMLAWVVVPFMYVGGNAPAGDDVVSFLYTFSQYFHPFIVSAVAAIIIGIGIVFMVKRRILGNFIAEIKIMTTANLSDD
ncbi:MAG: hypothetical protein NC124_19945 [Clostridium sp.]|nr:hypothetical protein [Clostridium sp.]